MLKKDYHYFIVQLTGIVGEGFLWLRFAIAVHKQEFLISPQTDKNPSLTNGHMNHNVICRHSDPTVALNVLDITSSWSSAAKPLMPIKVIFLEVNECSCSEGHFISSHTFHFVKNSVKSKPQEIPAITYILIMRTNMQAYFVIHSITDTQEHKILASAVNHLCIGQLHVG